MALRARVLAVPLVVVSLLVAGAVDASAQPGGGSEPLTASFVFTPEAPSVGATVTFTSTSQPSPGASITEFAWDLDGAGKFDDFNGATATWSFSEPGAHTVRLRVRQEKGKQAVATREVIVVAPAPPPPPAPGSPPPSGSSPLMLSPFPIVRIAGTVLPRGARVRILSVRAPRGARIRARCSGTGCPLASVARTSTTRVVRLRHFERRLPAGTRLGIFVRKGSRIGKYTRFVIRAGAPPRRLDLCLYPGRARPAPCP